MAGRACRCVVSWQCTLTIIRIFIHSPPSSSATTYFRCALQLSVAAAVSCCRLQHSFPARQRRDLRTNLCTDITVIFSNWYDYCCLCHRSTCWCMQEAGKSLHVLAMSRLQINVIPWFQQLQDYSFGESYQTYWSHIAYSFIKVTRIVRWVDEKMKSHLVICNFYPTISMLIFSRCDPNKLIGFFDRLMS